MRAFVRDGARRRAHGAAEAKGRAPILQRAARGAAPAYAPEIVHQVLSSPGSALDDSLQATWGARFNFDFSRVRVHHDDAAAESAHSVGAAAYTVGQHIAFARGAYSPGTRRGQMLLAHELAHVVQQGAAPIQPGRPVPIGASHDPYEAEADTLAVDAARSSHAEVLALRRGELGPTADKATAQGTSLQHRVSSVRLQRDDRSQESVAPPPPSPARAAPETHAIDGEFWVIPSGVRQPAEPIYDDDTGAVIAFRYSSGGYYEIYDLEGTFIESGEPGLERPLIDPIDILAGALAGLGRGLLFGGVRAAGRGAAGRGAAGAAGSAGLRLAARAISRAALAAVRSTYRAIRFRGALNFTATTAARMADPARRVPHHILKLAIRYGSRTPDPQGVRGAFMYTIEMFRNGRPYKLEVLLHEADRLVLHFLYR